MARRTITGIAAAAVLAAGAFASAAPAVASANTVKGCPSGAVCVYKPGNLSSGNYTYKFTTYGYHNVSNLSGEGALVENQTGGTNVGTYWCAGSGGTGKLLGAASGPNNTTKYRIVDPLPLGPIYSVILTSHYSQTPPASCTNVRY